MTALLSRDGTDFTLACDGCGQLVANLADVMHHWDLAWGLLCQHGWTGAALATGPHACPRCAQAPPPTRITEQALSRASATPARRRSKRITVNELPLATVVQLGGEPDLAMSADLYDLLLPPAGPRRHLVVDLSGAWALDSSLLVVLVRAQAHAARYAVEVCLVGLSGPMHDALRLLCLDHVWPTFADRAEALAWLRCSAPHRPTVPRQALPAAQAVEIA